VIAVVCIMEITETGKDNGDDVSNCWLYLYAYAIILDFLIFQFVKIGILSNMAEIIDLGKKSKLSLAFYLVFPSFKIPNRKYYKYKFKSKK
jgi:hypothetical protein